MIELRQKKILGSLSRLGGGSPREVAVELGYALDEVMPGIIGQANGGMVEQFTCGRAASPPSRQLAATDLENAMLTVTGRGSWELDFGP